MRLRIFEDQPTEVNLGGSSLHEFVRLALSFASLVRRQERNLYLLQGDTGVSIATTSQALTPPVVAIALYKVV
jgi:hypothetical protein